MSNPNPSLLDAGQIIKRAFDESQDKFRVDAQVSISGAQEVVISAADDSIKIGDGSGHYLAVNVDGSINATTTPPVGGATSAKQDTGNASLASIDTKLTNPLPVSGTFYPATQPVSGTLTAVTTVGTITNVVHVDDNSGSLTVDGTVAVSNFPATQPVSGTMTVQQSTASNLKVDLSGTGANATAIKVDGSAVTQPVSGTFWQSTQPVSATSLPLPTLAATSTKQSDGSQKTQIVDGSGNVIASTSNALNTSSAQSGTWNITNVSGTVSLPTNASTSGKQDTGNTSLANIDSKITAVNTGAVVISSSALPSLASTSTLQSTGNASLASIDTKTPSLGQAAMAASSPIVIASDQSAIPVTGTFYLSTQPVSAVSLPLPSNASQETGGNLDKNTLDNFLMKETLQEMVLELRAIRLALVAMVTEGQRNVPEDFDPVVQNFSNTLN